MRFNLFRAVTFALIQSAAALVLTACPDESKGNRDTAAPVANATLVPTASPTLGPTPPSTTSDPTTTPTPTPTVTPGVGGSLTIDGESLKLYFAKIQETIRANSLALPGGGPEELRVSRMVLQATIQDALQNPPQGVKGTFNGLLLSPLDWTTLIACGPHFAEQTLQALGGAMATGEAGSDLTLREPVGDITMEGCGKA